LRKIKNCRRGERPVKIARIRATPVNIPLEAPFRWTGGLYAGTSKASVEVETDEGLVGFETAFWDSAVADNNSFEQWRDEGMKDAPARAVVRVKRLLAEYRPPKLDPGIEEELVDFVHRRKAERPDQWR
jgi:L-alanine-DL-glutamate epimerase-like enolase superfamily enzyme